MSRPLVVAMGIALSMAPASSSAQEVKRGTVWQYTLNGTNYYTNTEPNPSQNAKRLFSYVQVGASNDVWIVLSSDDEVEVLVHPATITKSGSFATGWMMTNYKHPQSSPLGKVMSTKERQSLDCSSLKYEVTDSIGYSGKFGSGKTVTSWSGSGVQRSAAPGTIGLTVVKFICAGPWTVPSQP